MARVSVVLPAYNAATTIGRAVESILAQTMQELELIVVDDGSQDETAAIVERYLDDPRVRLERTPHSGVAAAANLATSQATAPFIARMDADDFSHPQRLQRQLDCLVGQQLDVVGSQVKILGQHGEESDSMRRYARWINEETTTPDEIMAYRFVEFPLVNPTILARRAYFDQQFRDVDLPEDYDLMLRGAALGLRFGKVAEVLLDWYDLPTRLTRSSACFSEQAFMRCRRHHLLEGPLSQAKNVDLWGLGETGKPWIHWLRAHAIEPRHAYDISQRKIGRTIHDIVVRAPTELAEADGTAILIAVGAKGARQAILPQLLARGYTPGVDAWFVA
jgi:glycosyltransferase involved in cell wall biosynthesis